MRRLSHSAFTLAELLIALAILGVIATFTIPKVLQSQQDRRFNAIAKETIAMVSGSFEVYKSKSTLSSAMTPMNLTPYMNYVSLDTSGAKIDSVQGAGQDTCNASYPCFRLHSGATLRVVDSTQYFGGTTASNYITYTLDPDGQSCGSASGQGMSISIDLFYNGRIKTGAERLASDVSYAGGSPTGWGADPNPSWFSW